MRHERVPVDFAEIAVPTARTATTPNVGALFPKKITPLPGSLHLEWRTCGKANCHCARGQRHGPYLVRRWWQAGKQRKTYIRKADVADAMAGIEAWQRLHPPAWTMRQLLAELHHIEEEILP
jgi:hypothetical protein